MNENEVLQMMDQLEVEHNNALSRWNELRRWLEYRLQQQAAQQLRAVDASPGGVTEK